jgi:ATP-dependent helicase/nuclease subunit B
MLPIEDRIKIIPIGQSFLRVLADYVREKFASSVPDFSNILIVFPSQRNKFYFRRYLLESAARTSIMPPVMKTVDELFGYCYESLGGRRGRHLNSIERNFVLKDVIDKLKVEFWKDLSFLRFIAVGHRLLNFFDELAKERVTLDDVEKESILGHYPEKYVRNELPILKKIYEEYRKALRESDYQDVIDQNELVHTQFRAEVLKDYEYILFGGLAATTVVEAELIRSILSESTSELILHSCPSDEIKTMDKTDRPFYVHWKLLDGLGVDFSKIETLKRGKVVQPVIHIKEVKTESEQTFYLQSVLKECIQRHKELHRIGIILPDESILYPVTESLRMRGIEYNRSAGLPLAQSILYSFLDQLHELIRSGFHYQEFFSFIRHPLFKNAVVNEQSLRPLIYGLQDFMIHNRLNFYKREFINDRRFDPLIDILQRGIDAANSDLKLSAYIQVMTDYLNELVSFNRQLIETNSPDIKEFFEQLHNLSSLRVAGESTARGSDVLEFLLWVLRDHTYRVEGDPMRGVQVIGLLEARNLDFDCLILPSMNEGVFPRRSEKDMFINQPVRRAVGLPYDQERDSLYYYYYTELTQGKKEVYISYVAEEERDVASRFISLGTPGARKDESIIKLARSAFNLHKRRAEKTPDVVKALYQYLQKDGLSPTALSDYRKCPYRYYLKYVLKVSEPTEIVEEPGAKEWGEIVHAAVRNFYRYHFPRGFSEKEMGRAISVIERELEKALKKSHSLALRPKPSVNLDLKAFKQRMHRFLETEVLRFEGGFEIFKSVLERRAKHYLSIDGAQVRVYGRIDRIDLREDRYYIIDYKTGKIPGKKNYDIGEDFNEFQLPLYALAFSKEHFEIIGGMMYYEIGRQARTVDIIEGKNAVDYLRAFRDEILVPTIHDLLDPEVAFYQTTHDEFCQYCIYNQLCGEEHGR